MEFAVFVVAAVIIGTGCLGVILSSNPVHSALFLVETLFGVAIIFVLQEAHFLAAVQIIVYAGAIVILFLFVIMLLGVDRAEDLGVDPIAGQRPVAGVVGGALAALAIIAVVGATEAISGRPGATEPLDEAKTDIQQIGEVLYSDYVVAFLGTALLLTIAVVGAVVLTRDVDEVEIAEPNSFDLPPVAPVTADHEGEAASTGDAAGSHDAGADEPEEVDA